MKKVWRRKRGTAPASPKIWVDEGVVHWKPMVIPKPKLKVPVKRQLVEDEDCAVEDLDLDGEDGGEKGSEKKKRGAEQGIEDDDAMPLMGKNDLPVEVHSPHREPTPEIFERDPGRQRYDGDRYEGNRRGET